MTPDERATTAKDIITELKAEEEAEVIDLSSPEDVIIRVIPDESGYEKFDWNGWSIDECTVLNGKEGVTGAASYEDAYGGFLADTIEAIADCPKKEGWFVVEGITSVYTRGDGWTTDDDMSFDHKGVRPATPEEITRA
jgi:hypothetical protein